MPFFKYIIGHILHFVYFREQQANEQLEKHMKEVCTDKENFGDVLLQYNQIKKQKDALEKDNLALTERLHALDYEVKYFFAVC